MKANALSEYLKSLPTPMRYMPKYDCYLKEEFTLPSGSHKDRETVHLLWGKPHRDYLCVTTGNAGISLAYYMGNKAHIMVPTTCSQKKRHLILKYGAGLIFGGETYEEAWNFGIKMAKERGWINLSPGVVPHRYKGDMEIAYEILDEEPDTRKNLYVITPAANHTLAYGLYQAYLKQVKVISVVLPNHPFLCRRMKLTDEDLKGYGSIMTSGGALERRWLQAHGYAVLTTSVSRRTLNRVREEHANDPLDLAVYLALEVSKRYKKGTKVVIGTGVRR